MASLYDLTQDILDLEAMYESAIDEETGEIIDAEVLEKLEEELHEMLLKKSDGIIRYFKNEESTIKSIKEEIDRLTALRKRKEKKLEGFKNYIETNMLKIGTKKIETGLGNISIRKSIQTVVNEDVIEFDERFAKKIETIKYDKTEIKKLLSEGVEIEGASLVENFSVSVK